MALMEWFHVVADELPIDTDYARDIPQGRLVSLDTDGYVKLALDTDGNLAIGLAGDSRSQGTTSYTPESGSASSTVAAVIQRPPKARWSSVLGALAVVTRKTYCRQLQRNPRQWQDDCLPSGRCLLDRPV
jgi:hypothetical protein